MAITEVQSPEKTPKPKAIGIGFSRLGPLVCCWFRH